MMRTKIKATKDIPPPGRGPGAHRKHEQLYKLRAGQNWLVPDVWNSAQLGGTLRNLKKHTGLRYVTRREQAGLRVYAVSTKRGG